MKLNVTVPVGLILLSTFMLAIAVYLSIQVRDMRTEIEYLNYRNYHDSTMLSEYQLGLEEFMEEDPMAAERFMRHIERAFE
jgi:hypothetical protein